MSLSCPLWCRRLRGRCIFPVVEIVLSARSSPSNSFGQDSFCCPFSLRLLSSPHLFSHPRLSSSLSNQEYNPLKSRRRRRRRRRKKFKKWKANILRGYRRKMTFLISKKKTHRRDPIRQFHILGHSLDAIQWTFLIYILHLLT